MTPLPRLLRWLGYRWVPGYHGFIHSSSVIWLPYMPSRPSRRYGQTRALGHTWRWVATVIFVTTGRNVRARANVSKVHSRNNKRYAQIPGTRCLLIQEKYCALKGVVNQGCYDWHKYQTLWTGNPEWSKVEMVIYYTNYVEEIMCSLTWSTEKLVKTRGSLAELKM